MEEFADCLGLFECSYCLQLFGSGDNLAAHRRDVHGFTDESNALSTQPQPTTVKTEILVKAEIHDRPPSCAGLKTEKVKKQDNVTSRNGAVLGELKIKNQRESGECAFIEEYISNDKVSPKKEPGLEEPPYRHYDTKNGILEAGNYSLNNGGEDDIIKSDLLGRRRHCSLGDLVQPEGGIDSCGGGMGKRVRTEFSDEQLKILHGEYLLNTNPVREELERIADLAGLTRRVTQVWFQNSRALQRKNKMRKSAKGLIGPLYKSPVPPAVSKSPIVRISPAPKEAETIQKEPPPEVRRKLSQPQQNIIRRHRRSRTNFTEEQIAILMSEFELDPKPLGKKLLRISKMAGLTRRVTQVWFQNSRALEKKSMPRRSTLERGARLSARSGSSIMCSDDSESASEANTSYLADEAETLTSVGADVVKSSLTGDAVTLESSEPSSATNGDRVAESTAMTSTSDDVMNSNEASTSVTDTTVVNSSSSVKKDDSEMCSLVEDDAVPSTSKCNIKGRLVTKIAHIGGNYTMRKRKLIEQSNRRSRVVLKRDRTKFSNIQLQILQSEFQLDDRPSRDDLQRISEMAGLSAKVVNIWFQNARAQLKKSAKPPSDSAVKARRSTRSRCRSTPSPLSCPQNSTSNDASSADSDEAAEVDKTQLAEEVMKNLKLSPDFFLPILSLCGGDIIQAVKMCFNK